MESELVDNRYKILKKLDTGGNTAVYKVRDIITGEILALKVLLDREEDQRRDFEGEFLLMRSINHPFFPRTFEFGIASGGQPYFTMEFVASQDLIASVRRDKTLKKLPAIIISICLALRCLHHRRMLHGDLKPQNIKVDEGSGEDSFPAVKILDLGLSRSFYRGERRRFSGTVNYLAPEIVLGEDVDHRSDIYALGVSLHEALTGKLPYSGRKIDVVKKIISGEIPPIGGVRDDIPDYLTKLIDSMVAVRPSDRPARVETIISRLEEKNELSDSDCGRAIFISPHFIRSDKVRKEIASWEDETLKNEGMRIRFIVGAEGMGKSSLMKRLKSKLQLRGVTTCWMGGTNQKEPFSAFKRVVKRIDPERYCGKEGDDSIEQLDYEEVNLVIDGLVKKMEGKRMAFFIDNVEDVDVSSLIALKLLLLGLSKSSPVCFMALREDMKAADKNSRMSCEGLKSFLTGLDTAIGSDNSLELNTLSRKEVAELVRGCLGEIDQGLDDLIDELKKITGGNPGLIEQFLIILSTDGILRFLKGTWYVDIKAMKDVRLPEKVDLQLLMRTAFLREGEEEILSYASILGEEFDLTELAELLGDWDQSRQETTGYLLKKGDYIIDLGKNRSRFNGRVLRDHFYGKLDSGVRKTLHRRALKIVGSRDSRDDPIGIARHYFGIDEHDKGIPYLKAAVEKYKEGGELFEALKHLEELGEWISGDKVEEFWVTKETGNVFFELKSFPAAEKEYRKAIAIAGGEEKFARQKLEVQVQLARTLIKVNALDEAYELLMKTGESLGWGNDTSLTGKVQREIGWIHFQRGNYKSAHRFYKKSLSVSRQNEDILNLLHLYNDIAVLYQSISEWQKANWWVNKGLKEGAEWGNREVVANARSIQGRGMKRRGYYQRAEHSYLKALDIYRDLRDHFGMSLIYNYIGELHRERGELEQAVLYQEKSMFLKEFLRNDIGVAFSLSNLGLAYGVMGKLNRSRKLFERSIGVRLNVGDTDGAGKVYGYLVEILIELEQWDEARKILDLQGELLEKSEDSYNRQYNKYLEGLIDIRMGSCDRAGEKLAESIRGYDKLGLREEAIRSRKDFSRSLLGQGRAEEALKEGLKALNAAQLIENQRLIIESHLIVAKILEEKGEEGRASEHYQKSLESLSDAPFKPLRAKVLLACAKHLFRRGVWKRRGKEASEFDDHLSEAESLFEEMGVSGKLREVRSLQERVSGGVREIGGRELFTLCEAGRIINSSLEIDVILNQLMDLIIQTMNAERGVIFVKDFVTGELMMEVARNVEQETIKDAMLFSSTILHDVQRRGEPIFIPDCREDNLCRDSISISRYSILSIICLPLRLKGEIIGTIYVDDRRTSHLFHQDDVDFLMSLGDMAALAIQNARLYRELEVANRRLEGEARDLRRQVRVKSEFHGMVGRHEKMQILYQVIEKVAQTDASVMIRGENGTGKELVARAIHYLSKRRDNPFIVVNCAAIPDALLESEIFGIEKGTATGVDRRVGKFEQADGGTLFLDEIGDMKTDIQAKLLRVLQEKLFQRLGGKRNISVDVKILSATNKDLENAIQKGSFREDLYYRLNTLPVFVPPLRERVEDIPLLVEFFLRKWSEENDRDIPKLGREVLNIMCEYAWPGNVRQLMNVIERMALLSSGGVLEVEDFPPELLERAGSAIDYTDREVKSLRDVQLEYVWKVFQRYGKNKKKTCEILGITYKTLQSYLSQMLE